MHRRDTARIVVGGHPGIVAQLNGLSWGPAALSYSCIPIPPPPSSLRALALADLRRATARSSSLVRSMLPASSLITDSPPMPSLSRRKPLNDGPSPPQPPCYGLNDLLRLIATSFDGVRCTTCVCFLAIAGILRGSLRSGLICCVILCSHELQFLLYALRRPSIAGTFLVRVDSPDRGRLWVPVAVHHLLVVSYVEGHFLIEQYCSSE
ncbi:uncharacterized protein SCHCODRAFT_02088901, partial [Schizophyllum commune H4-8]|uniref:uncharacterized protein n=1 Tax=Schizophyllum commune (strain H4-8 / FGSC 9210) TaxID=578458 RepID=UPI0021605B7C